MNYRQVAKSTKLTDYEKRFVEKLMKQHDCLSRKSTAKCETYLFHVENTEKGREIIAEIRKTLKKPYRRIRAIGRSSDRMKLYREGKARNYNAEWLHESVKIVNVPHKYSDSFYVYISDEGTCGASNGDW